MTLAVECRVVVKPRAAAVMDFQPRAEQDHQTTPTRIVNAMTVDVEDYFQVSAFEQYISRESWSKLPCRVEQNMDRILALFSDQGVKATFFTLGWIARRYPKIVSSIVEQGHELASHGWDHVRVTDQNSRQFAEDVRQTKCLLEDLGGVEVKGYRAPTYSINRSNLWAHDVLVEQGYQYSSSIVPMSHDLYGIPDAPRFAHKREGSDILEVPISTISLFGKNYSCGGGGWFRLYPYRVSRWAINHVNSVEQEPCVFYFHPWEFDPGQPRQAHLDLRTKFRHYLNLSKMEARISQLLTDFRWDKMNQVYFQHITKPSVAMTCDKFAAQS